MSVGRSAETRRRAKVISNSSPAIAPMHSLTRLKRVMSTASTAWLPSRNCGIGEHRLDLLVEGEAVGQAGQGVAQHLRAQAALGFDLGGLVDQRDHAALGLAGKDGQPGEADREMAAADAAAVGGVELEGGIVLLEEGGEPGADRARAEHRHLRDAALAEPLVPFGEEAELVVGAIDKLSSATVMIAAAIGRASR